MNIQRFLLPASIAAALHVAFLLGFNGTSDRFVRLVMVPRGDPPPPKPPDTPVVAPPEEQAGATALVRPLGGGSPPPDIECPLPRKLDSAVITITADELRPKWAADSTIVPKTFGPGKGEAAGPAEWSGAIIGVDGLDRVPRAVVQVSPDYPAAMRQSGITGSVTVEFQVDSRGRVVHAEAVRFTRREFAEPAVRAVLRWQFEPGKRQGRVVPFRMAIPMEFGLALD